MSTIISLPNLKVVSSGSICSKVPISWVDVPLKKELGADDEVETRSGSGSKK